MESRCDPLEGHLALKYEQGEIMVRLVPSVETSSLIKRFSILIEPRRAVLVGVSIRTLPS